MLELRPYSSIAPAIPRRIPVPELPIPKPTRFLPGDHSELATGWTAELYNASAQTVTLPVPSPELPVALFPDPEEVDPFYLFACSLQWERDEEPSAAWELIAAAQSGHEDTRAHARALLAYSRHFG